MTSYEQWQFNYYGRINRCIKTRMMERDFSKRNNEDIYSNPHINKFLNSESELEKENTLEEIKTDFLYMLTYSIIKSNE